MSGTKTVARRGSSKVISKDEASFEAWLDEGRQLAERHYAVLWDIGDWWNRGEPYGERVEQAAALFDQYTYGSLRNIASVAGRVDVSQRRDSLPFWTQAQVVHLGPEQQAEILAKAEADSLSLRDVRTLVRESPGQFGDGSFTGDGHDPTAEEWEQHKRSRQGEKTEAAHHREMNKIIKDAGLAGGWVSSDQWYCIVLGDALFGTCSESALQEFLADQDLAKLQALATVLRERYSPLVARTANLTSTTS